MMIRWSFRHDWPVLAAAGFLLLLPFSRLAEFPFALLALSAPWLLWRRRRQLHQFSGLGLLLTLGLAFWLPMVLSVWDSYDFHKSWTQAAAGMRLPLFAFTALLLIRSDRQHRLLLSLLAIIIGFWVVDGLTQAITGWSLLGYKARGGRLGGIFGEDIWHFGPVLAMLSPLLLEYCWLRQRYLLLVVALAAVMLAVLLAGMRAGWLLLPLLAAIYGWRFVRLRRDWRVVAVTACALAGLLLAAASQSDIVRERWRHTTAVLQNPDQDSLQQATTQRWLIWKTATRMIAAHPVNGAGVRAFPAAYPAFADADDPQLTFAGGEVRGSRHAHNLWLEALTDCGVFGLAGLLLFGILLWRAWRQAGQIARSRAAPYFIALLLILFPLNTHYSLYGTFLSTLIWWLAALGVSALHAVTESDETQRRRHQP